jgi:hypothetical protein
MFLPEICIEEHMDCWDWFSTWDDPSILFTLYPTNISQLDLSAEVNMGNSLASVTVMARGLSNEGS